MTGDRDLPPFDPLAIIEALNRHGVPFLVIGGIAAGVQGAMWATFDLDITYRRTRPDLRRLAAALAELEAGRLVSPQGFGSISTREVSSTATSGPFRRGTVGWTSWRNRHPACATRRSRHVPERSWASRPIGSPRSPT